MGARKARPYFHTIHEIRGKLDWLAPFSLFPLKNCRSQVGDLAYNGWMLRVAQHDRAGNAEGEGRKAERLKN
jgi:hypothetical protein